MRKKTKKNSDNKSDQRGFLLLSAFLIIAVLEIFSLALFARFTVFTQATERNQNKLYAFNAAEAALDNALVQLASNTSYSGVSTYTSMDASGNTGGYTVQVCPPSCDGLTTPTGSYKLIQAIGYSPSNDPTAKGYETRIIEAYVSSGGGAGFPYAIYGDTSVTLSGNATTDSYNSDDGAYGGSNVGTEGNVASDGALVLNGNAHIGGDSTSTTASLTGNATISGAATTNSGSVSTTGSAHVGSTLAGSTPGLNCSPGSTSLASLGSLSISGNNTVSLTAGSYHYSSLSISGNGRLNITTGPVTIYVDGTVSISGNGIGTASNLPTNLSVVSTSNGTVSISGNGDFYGSIYAPSSTVSNTGNGQIYGAVFANTYSQSGNGHVHYDEALADADTPCSSSGVSIQSWRETNTIAG